MNCCYEELNESGIGPPRPDWTKFFSSNIVYEFYTTPNLVVDSNKNPIIAFRTNSTNRLALYTFHSSNQTINNQKILTKFYPQPFHLIVIIKNDNNGNPLWIKTFISYNQYENDTPPNLGVDLYGNIFVGFTNSIIRNGESIIEIMVIKMDPAGCPLWYQVQTVANICEFEIFPNINVDLQGSCYLSYTSGLCDKRCLVNIHKINPWGAFVWSKQLGSLDTNGVGETVSGTTDDQANFYISYTEIIYDEFIPIEYNKPKPIIRKNRLGTVQIVASKISGEGNIAWIYHQAINNSGYNYDIGSSICVDGNYNIYLAYNRPETYLGKTFIGGHDLVLIKLNPSLGLIWSYTQPFLNIVCKYNFPNLTCDEEGHTYIVYESWSTLTPCLIPNIFLVLINPNGCYEWSIQFPSYDTLSNFFVPNISVRDNSIFIAYGTNNCSGNGDIVLQKLIHI